MERAPMQPQSNEQVNARNTAQLSAASPAQDHATSLIDTSPYVTGQSKSLQALFGEAVAQRVEDDEEPVQGRFETVQRVEDEEKEEPVQGKFEAVQRVEDEEEPLQGRFEPAQRVGHEAKEEPNNTGLPDNLKAGVESLSGISLDNVRVHYNSSQPAQLSALAYAQGNDIHVAPGQEQHLPHEAWHVVQQAQGRVQPTMQAKGTPINDDRSLENEADEMGRTAASHCTFEGSVTQQNHQGSLAAIEHSAKQMMMKAGRGKRLDAPAPDHLEHSTSAMATTCVLSIIDRGDFKFASGDRLHAEEKAINCLQTLVDDGSLATNVVHQVTFSVSKSPCSSTSNPQTRRDGKLGCYERLDSLHNVGLTKSSTGEIVRFAVSIAATKPYQPRVKGGKKASIEKYNEFGDGNGGGSSGAFGFVR